MVVDVITPGLIEMISFGKYQDTSTRNVTYLAGLAREGDDEKENA